MANPDTITIGGTPFDVYGPRSDADDYFQGKLNRTAWTGANGASRDRALVSATRLLDLEQWQGVPTDLTTPQPLAWPRTGVVDKNGQPVGINAFPNDLLSGYYELAVAIVGDPALDEAANQDANIKRVQADVVNVTFFRPVSGTRFPTSVHNYIKQFLDAGSTVLGGVASGTDECSEFAERSGQLWNPFK